MKFIIDIEKYFHTDCLKRTYYSDGKKCKSLENTTNGYSILRYDKSLIDMKNYDNAKNIGNMRSVVVSKDGAVVCCSPSKSIQWDDFVANIEDYTPIVEEYVEGTMINMFWDAYTNSWECATKNTIGCKSHYHHIDVDIYNQPKRDFLSMFYHAYYYNFLHFLHFDKTCCYSFVLQHPENRIVSRNVEPKLYLIACYKIVGTQLYYMDTDHIRSQVSAIIRDKGIKYNLRFPLKYEFTSVDDIRITYQSHPDYNVMGVVIKNPNTGQYSKIRNLTYMKIKDMVGNHTSLLYRYITLYKSGELKIYLKYFPEHLFQFNKYFYLIKDFTSLLEMYFNRISAGGHFNNYFTRNKPHHVNMVYHLKNLGALYQGQDRYLEASSIAHYVNDMSVNNLFYALKQFIRFSDDTL